MSEKPERASARIIAFHLPQFYPIPENDQWWGKGFTEWTNVGKARPLFRGHYQPRVPSDLGYYDMRVPETRADQAALAREYGIEGFCYWHYWFAGDRLLERPVDEIIESGEPDFPYCLAWANHSWTGIWYGAPKRILKEQTYPGPDDHKRHFDSLLPAFHDPRYIRIEGRPLFMLFRPNEVPNLAEVCDQWRDLARRNGLDGMHLVGIWEDGAQLPLNHGMDGATLFRLTQIFAERLQNWRARWRRRLYSNPRTGWFFKRFSGQPRHIYEYEEASRYFLYDGKLNTEYYPTAIPNFDNTPRSGRNGVVLHNSTPQLFANHLRKAIARVQSLPAERRLVFIKSWNEWAEGNHLEPDLRYGRGYLEVVRDCVLAGHKEELVPAAV